LRKIPPSLSLTRARPAEALLFAPTEVEQTTPPASHHVGDHHYALALQDLVCRGGGGAVGALDEHPAVDPVGVAFVDHSAECRRDQHVALDRQQVVGTDHLDAGELGQGPAVGDVLGEIVRVDPGLALDRAGRV
jgi:hypothetical protein